MASTSSLTLVRQLMKTVSTRCPKNQDEWRRIIIAEVRDTPKDLETVEQRLNLIKSYDYFQKQLMEVKRMLDEERARYPKDQMEYVRRVANKVGLQVPAPK